MNTEPNNKKTSLEQGLVTIYTGNGKGKTTAALGLAVRALACGLKVCIVYFMKGGSPCNEQNILSHFPDFHIVKSGQKRFVNPGNITEENKKEAQEAFDLACQAVNDSKYDVVILDEINVAVAWKLIAIEDVITLIQHKPHNIELVCTGRYADEKLIDLADLVTEMKEIKHPFQKGISSREGIDY